MTRAKQSLLGEFSRDCQRVLDDYRQAEGRNVLCGTGPGRQAAEPPQKISVVGLTGPDQRPDWDATEKRLGQPRHRTRAVTQPMFPLSIGGVPLVIVSFTLILEPHEFRQSHSQVSWSAQIVVGMRDRSASKKETAMRRT